jgi:hypothetical protein
MSVALGFWLDAERWELHVSGCLSNIAVSSSSRLQTSIKQSAACSVLLPCGLPDNKSATKFDACYSIRDSYFLQRCFIKCIGYIVWNYMTFMKS